MPTASLTLPLKVLLFCCLLVSALAFLAPMLWMLSTSLKPLNETMTLPPVWIPSEIQWRNYPDAIAAMGHFWRYAGNSLFLAIMTVIGTVTSPFPVVMVPLYGLFKSLGWIGTFKPLWAPAFLAGAFNVFLLRQFFLTLPKDMAEAARIDGCNELQIFWHIILPLSKPALLVVAIFQFMATWNDFLGPLIYLTEQKDFTLALGLQSFQSQQGGTAWHQLMAASTLVVLPVIVLFFLTQRTFIEGIAATGSKN